MIDSQVIVNRGRVLAYTDIGEPDWPCVLFFHGAPSSRLRLAYLEQRILGDGIRVVSPDRPGYGGSSIQPRRSLTDWAHDVAVLADALGLDRFLVAGHSSGGPYAVACAAQLTGRVSGGVILGGVTDMAWPGAWEGFLETERQLMRLPDEQSAIASCLERFGADGSGFMTASGLRLPEPDERLYADEQIASQLALSRAEAFRQGVVGYAQDVIIQGRPWSFDASGIAGPVLVVHGAGDTIVPLSHSRHTAELIPTSTLRVLPGHGHFTILEVIPALVRMLV